MILKKYLFRFFTILFFNYVSVVIVFGCRCGEIPTVLSQFESSKDVFIAKIVSWQQDQNSSSYYLGVETVKMLVKTTFKGNLQSEKEILVASGSFASCQWEFKNDDVGRELLIYSASYENDLKLWVIGSCGRTTELTSARDDLLYLNNIDKVKGKSRISGTLHYWGNVENKPSDENQIIKITNAKTKKIYKVKTNKDGVYEIYGLPAGWYYVETQPAKGWFLDNKYWRYLPIDYQAFEKLDEKDFPQNKEPWSKPDAIYLFSKRHAGLDFNFSNQE